jgi:hydrogenase maturation protein HypF
MKSFKMCQDCASEYNDMSDRRFHAQPIACNKCGPHYQLKISDRILTGIEQILAEVSNQVSAGKTIAIKGLGGYHLMCDALNNEAIKELRRKKQRDSKPFAVMFRDISAVRDFCFIDEMEEKEITSWRRPILILKQKKELSENVNNGLNSIGAMLPYMPVHHMLFKVLVTPAVIFTSGNISDEPVIIDDRVAETKLLTVADSLMSYNREINNRADDSVLRIVNSKKSLIRRSRGFVPSPVDLSSNVEGILALGAEQKSSFCIGKDKQAIMSQYIGDLKNLPTYDFFKESIEKFSRLFRFKPKYLVCDLHPDYLSTSHAELLEKQLSIPLLRVQHHHAHITSCMAEYNIDEPVIGISMDGTGYGTDGNIWGGEFLIADLKEFKRYSHFDYVPMPGNEKAVNEPWRMAFSYLYKYFGDSINYADMSVFQSIDSSKLQLIKEMIIKKINSPLTSGAGRLFDAISAILGLCKVATFDSEAPMRLESVINCNIEDHYPFKFDKTVEFAETLLAIINDLPLKNIPEISAKFHNTVAQVNLEVSIRIRQETSINKVVLSGGVFQNKYLLRKSFHLLSEKGFDVFTNQVVPANDGGISLGQLIIASKTKSICV